MDYIKFKDVTEKRILKFYKSNGNIHVEEGPLMLECVDESSEERPQDNYTVNYRCTGSIYGSLDGTIIGLLKRAFNNQPIKIMGTRWYPHKHPRTFLSSGNVFIIPTVECKGKRITLTLKFARKQKDGKTTNYYNYIITGYKKVEALYDFMNNAAK